MAAARKSGLGRGLESLIPVERPHSGFADIPIDRIRVNPHQPRRHFDEEALEALTASIREVGILQPIVVQEGPDDDYTLIAGERRWRAARRAGLAEVPAAVREADEVSSLAQALVENIQREDLTPLEEAAAYQELLEEYGLTHEAIGERVGKSRAAVSNTLRLLQLPAGIQGLLDRGEISTGHARALLGLEDVAYAQHVAERAAAEGLSVRQVEDAVRARREPGNGSRRRARTTPRPPVVIELEERLEERLGAPVRIDMRGERGRLVVRFGSLDDLERIYRSLFS